LGAVRALALLGLAAVMVVGVGDRARAGICPCPYGDALTGVAVAPDGRIVAVGVRAGSRWELLLGRYLPDGRPDPTFGDGGRLVASAKISADFGARVFAVAADGRFLVSDQDELLSFRTDGTLEPSFGDAGVVKLPAAPVGVVPLADGRVVVALPTGLRMLRPDGSTDAAYGSGGLADTAKLSALEHVAAAGDGKVLAAGRLATGGAGVVRLLADGRVDDTFGRDGVVRLRAEAVDLVASTADGGVVVGWSTPPAYQLERLLPDGTPDTSFGSGGTLVFGQLRSDVKIAPRPDGTIVVYTGGSLLRLLPDGALDPSFGSGGHVSASSGVARAFAVATDGSIVVAGSRATTGGGAILLGYAPDGTPDPRFSDFSFGRADLYAADLARGYHRLTEGALINGPLTISPDRSRIAYLSDRTGNEQLYVAAVDGSHEREITAGSSFSIAGGPLAWSPHGDLIAFTAYREVLCLLAASCAGAGTWLVGADGSDPHELAAGKTFLSWSPDGRQLLLLEHPPNAPARVFEPNVDGRLPVLLASGTDASWSPRGDEIAVVVPTGGGSNPYARTELVRPDGRLLARLGAGDDPAWAPNGRELLTTDLRSVTVFRADGRRVATLRKAYAAQWTPDGRIAYMTGKTLRLASASGRSIRATTRVSLASAQLVWTGPTTFALESEVPLP
jgi:uncharacterized delta-60 repeat protein